ncbi:MAG: hypothetical protein M1431_03835 [Candidatus Thermoplasmatota archaeon]|nr:hypothetical protein [Candidatus Thermoplasmatota archaeon]
MKLRLDIPVTEIRNLNQIIHLEMKEVVGRSRMDISNDQENYHIDVESPDMASFRAAVSSITRWLIIIKRIEEVN